MLKIDTGRFTDAIRNGKSHVLREMGRPFHDERLDIAKNCEKENRDFTNEERERDSECKASVEMLMNAARRVEAEFYGTPVNEGGMGIPLGNAAIPGESQAGGATPTGAAFRNEAGMLLRAYKPGESIDSGGVPGEVGDTVRDLWGDRKFSNASQPIGNAAIGGGDSEGGYLLNPRQSGRLIDLARSASVVNRAGAQTVNMSDRTMHLLTVESDPSATWRAETVKVPASSPTFGRISLEAKTLAAIVPISLELAEDSANGGQVIEDLIARALAAELDRAALLGSGAGAEPRGIVNASGVNSLTGVGTPDDYSDLTSAVREIYEANYAGEPGGLSLIYNPQVAAVYDGLVSSADSQPLQPTPWAGALKRFMTNKIGSDQMLVGDFGEVLIGVRSNVRIRVLPAGTATDSSGTTWNAADQLMYLIVAHMRADVAVMRPPFFTVLDGVTTS